MTRLNSVSTAYTGYQAPTVTVATSLPKRGAGSSVLIVPVVSAGTRTGRARPCRRGRAVPDRRGRRRDRGRPAGAGRHGRQRAGHRLVVPSLPVASVLTVGLGKAATEWPADMIRRAAGVAARSLSGTETVITTLSDCPATLSAPPPSRG